MFAAHGATAQASPSQTEQAAQTEQTEQAARQIIASVEGQGADREAAARRLEELGDPSVPALIEAKARPNSLETRKWAIAVLEAMNKKIPGEAVQTKDSALLAEVLLAYGKTRDLDAVGAVFAFANAGQSTVREASREAIRRYGSDAMPKLRETYTNIESAVPPETWSPGDLARELFRAMDHVRLRDVYALLDDALAKAATGTGNDAGKADKPSQPDQTAQLDAAVQELDQVFARAPDLDRRGEAVPIYVRYARSLEDGDASRALDVYHRAERLAQSGTEKDRITSAIVWLEARKLEAHGIVDREALERALALDPENSKAKADYVRLADEEQTSTNRLRLKIGAAAVLLLLLAATFLFVPLRRRR
ncbi:MAG TPA: hypothetical protein VNO21_10810 [Polyangiaceae bacterium]|nr:hypothetical protein [Polyangiaceae bacterium]